VTLDGGLEDFVRGLVARTESAVIRQTREAAEEVARSARAAWYGPNGVTRKTGRSGQIVVRESIDISAGTITISVGSADTRTAGNKPVPVYVHRPKRTSAIQVPCTPDEWYAAASSLRAPWRDGPVGRTPYLYAPNPKASDGKHLLVETVKKPMKKRIRRISRDIAREVARG
jgi:hypothetical protein